MSQHTQREPPRPKSPEEQLIPKPGHPEPSRRQADVEPESNQCGHTNAKQTIIFSKEKGLTGPPSVWPAGVPFLPSSLGKLYIYTNDTNTSISRLPVNHVFDRPVLPESEVKTGDPVKRSITSRHRNSNQSIASLTDPLPFTLHGTVSDQPLSFALPVLDRSEIMESKFTGGPATRVESYLR